MRTAAVAGRAVPDRLLAEVAGIGDSAAVRRAARNGGQPPARGRSRRPRLRLQARADEGRGLRGHAAGRARPAARGVRRRARSRTRALAGETGDQATLAASLAYHWYAALDLPRALPASVDAAAHATDSYAPAEALRHLERALEIWPRVADARERTGLDRIEVSRRAADAAYRSGALDRSQSLLADAMAELPAAADPVRQGAAPPAVRARAAGFRRACRRGGLAA